MIWRYRAVSGVREEKLPGLLSLFGDEGWEVCGLTVAGWVPEKEGTVVALDQEVATVPLYTVIAKQEFST